MTAERRKDLEIDDAPGGDSRSEQVDAAATGDAGEKANGALLPERTANDFRTKWESIQGSFVDEPRQAVTDADALVGEVMDRLRATFEDQRQSLEAGWSADDSDADTEDLRIAFRRYRSFFERLLQT
jgi:hypothetical protein